MLQYSPISTKQIILVWENMEGLQDMLKKRFDILDQTRTGRWIQY